MKEINKNGGKLANRYIQLLIMNEYRNLKLVGVSNWDGVAYIGNRRHISLLSQIEQLTNPGIYFLLGANEEHCRKLYIGESENISNRLQSHACNVNKNWFEDFIIFTSKKGDLNKAHVKYLEAVFIEMAREILTTIDLKNDLNSNAKKDGKLQTFDLAKAEGFKEQMIFVLNNLNLINFVDNIDNNTVLSLKIFNVKLKRKNKDKRAKLVILDNGYRLLKGSYLERETKNSFSADAKDKRNELIHKGLIIEKDNLYFTTEDIFFKSPSAAGVFVLGRSSNGRTEWRLEDGTSLNEFELKNETKKTHN